MSDPIAFPSSTPSLGLPLLVAGQAQKEFFVNQALSVLDAVQMRTVSESRSAPPAAVAEGDCFRVTAPAGGPWSGHEDAIAVLVGGDWHFIAPREGMLIFDRASGHQSIYRSQWEHAEAPTLPANGTVVDVEARATLAALIGALQAVGILAPDAP